MKHEYFVEQPNIELKKGIMVREDTELLYKNENVEQVLKDLTLETILNDRGSNGINTYESKSYLKINLNSGDILLFHEQRGYYMPPYPVVTIEDAISDITSLEGRNVVYENEEVEHDTGTGTEESAQTD